MKIMEHAHVLPVLVQVPTTAVPASARVAVSVLNGDADLYMNVYTYVGMLTGPLLCIGAVCGRG